MPANVDNIIDRQHLMNCNVAFLVALEMMFSNQNFVANTTVKSLKAAYLLRFKICQEICVSTPFERKVI